MPSSLSYAAGPTDRPMIDATIGDSFDAAASAFPEREALVEAWTGRRWTYSALRSDVDALARALIDDGVDAGDRIGIWAPNCAEWTIVQFAAAKIGAVVVNINPAYRSHELTFVLNQSAIRIVFAFPEFKTSNYRSMLTEAATQAPALERAVYFGSAEWEALLQRGLQHSPGPLSDRQKSLLSSDPINIQYTSGTTGSPKGVTLSHRNILNNGYFVGELVGYTEQDRICVPVPFYHCFGMVMGNLGASTHGACVVIPSPAFDPVATLAACEQERCTTLYGVPTMFIAMLAVPDFTRYELSSIRTGIMAGSPCPVEIMRQVVRWVPEVTIAYGMTETSPASLQTAVDDPIDRRVSTVGKAHPHTEIKIVDPASGATVERGTSGELCVRGYSVMIGYWNEPEKTAATIDSDGWIHSGDLASMDENGYVAITGRIKDMVIRGGENVYPREIEEFLYTHPDILDAQVIGVPDPKYGEELMVWVRLRGGSNPLSAADLKAFCHGRLASFKIPKYVHCVDEFPMTLSGKVRKAEMRNRALSLLET
jgi:fatty-acyl-CoA synthase